MVAKKPWAKYIVWYYESMPEMAQWLLLQRRNQLLDQLAPLTKRAEQIRQEISDIHKQIR